MTKVEVTKMFEEGKAVLLVEYRSSRAERITYRDKVTRATVQMAVLRHSCEAADGSPYMVNERVAENFDEKGYHSAFQRGQRAVLIFTSMTVERGIPHFVGQLYPLESK